MRLESALRARTAARGHALRARMHAPSSAPAQAQSGRDTRQRVPDVLAALALNSGSRVADVGAGSGYFLPHLSAAVGPTGRVYGVDISETALSQMRRLIEEKGLANVVVVQGEVDDPHLPAQSLSSALMVDAYHEMTEHESMLARTFESLEAGGRLVVLDLAPYDESTSRAHQTAGHGIGLDLVERDLTEAGFEVLVREPEFAASGRGRRQWMLVARRPAG